jgi:hypothetical protein
LLKYAHWCPLCQIRSSLAFIFSRRFLPKKKKTTTMATASMNGLGFPKLETKTPVPSDIEISQTIVKDVGLLSMDQVAKQYVGYHLFVEIAVLGL